MENSVSKHIITVVEIKSHHNNCHLSQMVLILKRSSPITLGTLLNNKNMYFLTTIENEQTRHKQNLALLTLFYPLKLLT